MQECGAELGLEAACVRCVTVALEGAAAEWMVSLCNNAPQLRNYDHFMGALRQHFEDPLAEHKARTQMKTLIQGRRLVAAYTQES